LAEIKDVFSFVLVGKYHSFLLCCFPSPPVLVGPMEIALTDVPTEVVINP